MKKYLVIIIALLGNLDRAGAQIQAANPELAALVSQAFDHYPKFRELDAATQSAAIRVDMARSQYRPTVSSEASMRYVDPLSEVQFGTEKFAFQPHDNYNAAIGANGLIFDFGRTKAQIQKALAEAELSKGNSDALHNAIAYQVAHLYYGIVFTQKSLEVQSRQLNTLQANLDLISTKLKNGDALELDQLNAQVALANAQNLRTDLQAQLEKQLALMTLLTGTENVNISIQAFDFQGNNDNPDISQNPDISIANAKIAVAENDINLNKHYLRPALTYNSDLGFRNGFQPDIHEFRFNWGIGIGLAYPLYVGGRERMQLRLSQLSLDAAKASAQATTETLRSEVAQAQADLKASTTKMQSARTTIAQAEAALALARSRYQNGVATNVDVLTAEGNLSQAELTALQTQYQRCLANLHLSRAAGVKFW